MRGPARRKEENVKIIVEGKRFDTDRLIHINPGRRQVGTGITRENVWLAPRSRRVIVETYSVWENPQTHGVYGTSYHIATASEIAALAAETGDERLMELVPEAD